MIDQRDIAVQRHRAGRAIGRDQRAIATADAPVEVAVLIGVPVQRRHVLEFAAVDVGRDRVDHGIPAIAGLEAQARGLVLALLRGLPEPLVECVHRAHEIVALGLRKRIAKGALAPGRQVLVDLEAELLVRCGTKEFLSAECSQPQPTSKVTSGEACTVQARPPSRSRASSTITERPEPCQRMRRAEAGCAGADDRDVDGGREGGHGRALARSLSVLKPARYAALVSRDALQRPLRCCAEPGPKVSDGD